MRDIKIGRRYHMSITKSLLLKLVMEDGPDKVLDNFKGNTYEAIESVQRSPNEYFVIGDCDNEIDGQCQGHDN